MGRSRFEAEFGRYAAWVVDAIQSIGFADRVPAACRGTGNPFLLQHLAAPLGIGHGSAVLDVGVGLGGPGAWLLRRHACRVVGVDIMIEEARGARRLFPEINVAVASTRALPFRDRSFDAAWALGVIEMIADKRRAFQEIVRVLVPGARVVLYDFVATESTLKNPPAASRFEPAGDIAGKLQDSGLDLLQTTAVPALTPAPDDWRAAMRRVRERVEEEHGGDRRLSMAEEGRKSFNRLRRSGSIQEWEFIAEKPRG
ncbi:MAG: class I SAM-dependent methyltransferase [Actinomycetota bacterium]